MRQQNWYVDLIDWGLRVRGAEHVWGKTDCLSLVSAALEIMYGRDVLALKSWSSKRGLVARVRKQGGPVAMAERFCYRINEMRATVGDVVLSPGADLDLGFAAMVMLDGWCLAAIPGSVLTRVPVGKLGAETTVWRADVG